MAEHAEQAAAAATELTEAAAAGDEAAAAGDAALSDEELRKRKAIGIIQKALQ